MLKTGKYISVFLSLVIFCLIFKVFCEFLTLFVVVIFFVIYVSTLQELKTTISVNFVSGDFSFSMFWINFSIKNNIKASIAIMDFSSAKIQCSLWRNHVKPECWNVTLDHTRKHSTTTDSSTICRYVAMSGPRRPGR